MSKARAAIETLIDWAIDNPDEFVGDFHRILESLRSLGFYIQEHENTP